MTIASLRRKHALIVLGISTVAFTVLLELIDPSHVSHGPLILAFEFAWSKSHAARIIAEWGPKGRSAAHLSLVLDYGYMLSYGLFFCLAGFAIRDSAREHGWRRLATAGIILPFFALAAAAFDATENVALLFTLAGNGGSFAPPCSREPALVTDLLTWRLRVRLGEHRRSRSPLPAWLTRWSEYPRRSFLKWPRAYTIAGQSD